MKKIFGNVEAIVATFAKQKPRKKCLIQRKSQDKTAAHNTGLVRTLIVGFFVFVYDKFILNIQKARPNQSGFFLGHKVTTTKKFFNQKVRNRKKIKNANLQTHIVRFATATTNQIHFRELFWGRVAALSSQFWWQRHGTKAA